MHRDTPEACTQRFADCVGRGDLDGVAEIFEPSASILSDGGTVVRGSRTIRAAMAAFVESRPLLDVKLERVIDAGDDLSIVYNQWRFRGMEPEGEVALNVGTALTVLRRRADGPWRIVFSDVNYTGRTR